MENVSPSVRWASPGLARVVDINLIPFPMIDHIDILKDGASAVYGSDALPVWSTSF